MTDEPDYADIERMYRSGIQGMGVHAPALAIASGRVILSMLAPEDARRAGIDPTRMYLIAPERLTVVEYGED